MSSGRLAGSALRGKVRWGVVAVLGGILAAVAVPAAMGETSGPVQSYRYWVSSTYVQVPVTVLDAHGRPVAGLSAGDFRLTDEGQPEEIADFEAVRIGEGAVAEQVERVPVARRNFLFLFDLTFTHTAGLARAQEAAAEFVRQRLAPTDLVAVATYSAKTGLRFLVTFTPDHAQAALAIADLGLGLAHRRSDPLAFAFDLFGGAGLERGSGGASAPLGGRAETDEAGATFAVILEQAQKMQAREQQNQAASLIDTFAALGEALDMVLGRKHIVYVSRGIDDELLIGGATLADLAEAIDRQQEGQLWRVDLDARYGAMGLKTKLARALAGFVRSDAVIHTVDVNRLVAASNAGGDGRVTGQASLFMLANDTGGSFYKDTNDLGGALDSIERNTSEFYVLGFSPTRQKGNGAYHRLKVALLTPARGAKVIHRPGYFEPRRYEDLGESSRQLQAASLIINNVERQDIPLEVFAAPFPTAGAGALVPVVIEVPELARADRRVPLKMDLYAYAMDRAGNVADAFAQEIGLDPEALARLPEGTGLKYYGVFLLAPGDYEVKTMLLDKATGRAGLRVRPLAVPAFATGEAVVLPPLLFDDHPHWVIVRHPDAVDPARFPFILGGRPFLVAASPVVTAGATQRIGIFVYNVRQAVEHGAFGVRAVMETEAGEPVPGAVVRVAGGTAADGEPEASKFLLVLDAGDVPPATYRLRVELEDQLGGRTFSTGEVVRVVPATRGSSSRREAPRAPVPAGEGGAAP